MSILFAFIGVILGGSIFHIKGAVVCAVIGFFYGNLHELRQSQKKLEREVAWARSRLSEHVRAHQGEPVPAQAAPSVAPITPNIDLNAEPEAEEKTGGYTTPHEWGQRHCHERSTEVKETGKGPEPAGPSPFTEMIGRLFSSENLLVKLGVVILFLGISFLVKFATQHGLLPIELRLSGAAVGGCVLLAIGWRLRSRRTEYALAVQGGGIGILYLTTYAAFRLFALIPALPAFGLLVGISVLCATLAVLQEARTLALFGVSGGFVAPLLASIGVGQPGIVFGYYTVLNALVIAVAWFRSWRSVNLAGFLYTFICGALWGAQFYRPQYFGIVEPFLVSFFLMYILVAVLFAFRQPPDLKGIVDGTIVFGTPMVAFALQSGLVGQFRYGLAWSAVGAGLVYCFAAIVMRRCARSLCTLSDAFLALGVVFLTIAIPLAFDGRWTSAAWAMEGVAMVWAGSRMGRLGLRWCGVLLQVGAGAAFLTELSGPTTKLPVLNGTCLGALLLSLSALGCSRIISTSGKSDRAEEIAGRVLTAVGSMWWFFCGFNEIAEFVKPELVYNTRLVFIAASCAGFHLLERRLVWRDLAWPAVLLAPAIVLYAGLGRQHHPATNFGWLAWPMSFATVWWLLKARHGELVEPLRGWLHAITVWLVALLGTWELGWQIYFFLGSDGSWLFISRGLVPCSLVVLMVRGSRHHNWPLGSYREAYLGLAAQPLVLWSTCWILAAAFTCKGESWPFLWLPILNQLDLAMAFHIYTLAAWLRELRGVPSYGRVVEEHLPLLRWILAAVVFIWLNSVLARALHFWGKVPFDMYAMFNSTLVQTSFTLFWSLVALSLMVTGFCRRMRAVWIAGAGLLGTVVIKLFLVDLANHGSVERIISFVAVGVLMLVIGWHAPVPPRDAGPKFLS